MTSRFALAAGLVAATLAGGCSLAPPAPVAPPLFVDTVPPAERVAAVNRIADARDNELAVQPLRDPEVEDLRELARQAVARADLTAAAHALDQALALSDRDPGVHQERAELALLSGQAALAEKHARMALGLGSRTGPLCRRHWATVWQAWLARGDALNAASAQAQIDSCTVPPIERY